MGRRKYAEGMVVAGAVYQDIKDTSQNVIYVRIKIFKTLEIKLCFS